MELTKEECLKNICAIEKQLIVVDDYETGATYLECEDEIENIKQLINEHFDSTLINYYQVIFREKSLTTLFEQYAFEDDNLLSKDAIELKRELLDIVDVYNEKLNKPLQER